MKTLTLQQMHAAYQDVGQGPSIIFAHCSSANHKEWAFMSRVLASNYRVLAPDFLGYGESSPWPDDLPPATDVDVIEALIAKADAPVHLIGHSYGAAVCLEAARRDAQSGGEAIRSLFLIEPVSFHLLRTANRDQEWEKIAGIAHRCITASAKGNWKQAANSYMGFWLGPLKWRLTPKPFRNEVIRTIPKVAHECQDIFEYDYAPEDYAHIECPMTLVCGERSPRPASVIVELLKSVIRDAEQFEIRSAGHMSPFTHKRDVELLIQSHLERSASIA